MQSIEITWEGAEGLLPMAPHRTIEAGNAMFLAEAVEVCDRATFDQAANLYRGLTALKKQIQEALTPIVENAHKAHKAATSLRGEMVKPIESAAALVKGKMEAWDREQERLRKEEEERRRLAAEEEARRKAGIAGASEEGPSELEYVVDDPGLDAGPAAVGEGWLGTGWVPVPNLSPADAAAREGVQRRRNWQIEVIDPQALVAAVGAGDLPLDWVEIKTGRIIEFVRERNGEVEIPGVRFERVPELVIQQGQG